MHITAGPFAFAWAGTALAEALFIFALATLARLASYGGLAGWSAWLVLPSLFWSAYPWAVKSFYTLSCKFH